MIHKQLVLINDMINYYGINHTLPHKLIDTMYEYYTINYDVFSNDDEQYLFLLIEKLSHKFD